MSAAYLYNKHLKEPALRNTNLPPPIPGPGGRNLYNISTRRSELPDPRIFINNEFQAIGQSEYDGLVLEFRQRFNDRLQFNASWTLSHAIDYIPDAIFDVPYASDQNNLEADRGNSLQDQRHKVSFSGVLVTPHGLERRRVAGPRRHQPRADRHPGVAVLLQHHHRDRLERRRRHQRSAHGRRPQYARGRHGQPASTSGSRAASAWAARAGCSSSWTRSTSSTP